MKSPGGQMNLAHLNDQELHDSGIRSVKKEREATLDVLYHLMEINKRKLFSKWQCKSLHHYAETIYGYPGKQAYQRITAMKLLKEFPEITQQIKDGRLTLTHLNDAKALFKKTSFKREEKLELLKQFSTLTTREAEKVIVQIVPGLKVKDQTKLIAEDTVEFRFVGSLNLEKKLKELKERLAHTHPQISMGELIELLVEKELDQIKGQTTTTENSRRRENPRREDSSVQPSKTTLVETTLLETAQLETVLSKTTIAKQVWNRDHHACTICQSTYALEIYIIPKAKGGTYTLSNLRLLCRNCNQRYAIEHYGLSKMQTYLGKEQ